MRNYFIIPAILIAFAGMLACEKVVDFQQTAYKPKLVLYGALFQDSVPEIMVGRTQSYYGWQEGIEQQAYVEGASVSLSEGQASQALTLGPYKSDFFNVWEGLPDGHSYSLDFYRVSSPYDSTYRIYEGSQALKGGTWYEFEATHEEESARRSIYIPNRPQALEVSARIRDTSYTDQNIYGEGSTSTLDERQFVLTISYQITDDEPLWHRPLVTYEEPIFGYYVLDRRNEYGGYWYVEDSIDAKVSLYSFFTPTTGSGRVSQEVILGSISARATTYPDGYTYNDTSYYFPVPYEDVDRILLGDTLEQEFRVSGLLSYAQDETIEFTEALLTQRYGSTDPFNFVEPVIVNTNDEEGLGLLGGFAESEAEVVKVKFYR